MSPMRNRRCRQLCAVEALALKTALSRTKMSIIATENDLFLVDLELGLMLSIASSPIARCVPLFPLGVDTGDIIAMPNSFPPSPSPSPTTLNRASMNQLNSVLAGISTQEITQLVRITVCESGCEKRPNTQLPKWKLDGHGRG